MPKYTWMNAVNVTGKALSQARSQACPAKHNREQVEEFKNTRALTRSLPGEQRDTVLQAYISNDLLERYSTKQVGPKHYGFYCKCNVACFNTVRKLKCHISPIVFTAEMTVILFISNPYFMQPTWAKNNFLTIDLAD